MEIFLNLLWFFVKKVEMMTKMKNYLLFIALVLIAGIHIAISNKQTDHNSFENDYFSEIALYSDNMKIKDLPIGSAVAEISKFFLNAPYKGATLEGEGAEQCRYDFTGLDCVTLVENSLALARIIKKGDYGREAFIRELTFIRYRKGVLSGYASRLHYTSDWIFDNGEKGVIENISKTLSGKRLPLSIYFMSANSKLYPALKDNPPLISEIASIEEKTNKRVQYFVPLNKIKSMQNKIQTGDIIAIATNKEGLDYSHVGIAYVSKGKTQLIHASSKQKKVVIEDDLQVYVSSVKSNIGIAVLRPMPVE